MNLGGYKCLHIDFYMQTVQQKFISMGRKVYIRRLNIFFEGSDHSISLDVPGHGITTDEWRILPLCYPRVCAFNYTAI